MALGSYVRERRRALKLPLPKAAAQWGLSKSALWRVEEEERIDLRGSTLLKLARGLGITVDELLEKADGASGS